MLRNLYGMSHIIAWGIFLPGAFLIVLFKCCLTCHDEYTYNQSRLIHRYEEIEDEVMDEKIQEVAKKQAEDNIGFFFHEPRLWLMTSSFEKNNENSEKLKNGTKQLWSKFSITNGKMPMVKSLQFYHLLTISQMSGLSLSTLVIHIVCNILCSNPENIETEKAFKVTFKNSVNGKIRNTSSLKRM